MIVDWDKDVSDYLMSSEDQENEEAFLTLLKLDASKYRWTGKINFKKKFAELRLGTRGGTSALAVVGDLRTYARKGLVKHSCPANLFESDDIATVKLSANGTMYFTLEEISLMNLAIIEAKNIIKNVIKKELEEKQKK